ncbi:hypothetical protein [Gallaecimonas mangrovi]|uniref:hypothetical protein n=1 Tax=Gallaecimonas mangrovi TaxID=2291597 RepID=UPI000E203B2E|nr:hypothetical protein [Gallaecimonas mangrovi]
MLNKKLTLHLDALLVIALLFMFSIAFNFYQNHRIKSLTHENLRLQLQQAVDQLNLKAQQDTIKQLAQNNKPHTE